MTTQKQNTDMFDDYQNDFIKNMTSIAERSQKIVNHFVENCSNDEQSLFSDTLNINQHFLDFAKTISKNPDKLVEAQFDLWKQYLDLWENTSKRMMGEDINPLITPEKNDKRFKSDDWRENYVFNYIKQSYLITAQWVQSFVEQTEGLDEQAKKKVDFYTKQFVDALSPTNFILTNPTILKTTIESKGENLIKGLNNLLRDLEEGKGKLKIKMTDTSAFDVGENIAVTKGKVIYQNDLMQLIQYEPTTKKVDKTPVLIIPPWINKYYILDLRSDNSYIKWIVDQGYSVFTISWVNPTKELASKTFEDYLTEGPLNAMKAIEKHIGKTNYHVVGYCLGGTLLSCLLSVLHQKKDKRIQSATFLTSMIDFEEAGDLSVFIDEEQIKSLENTMEKQGILDAHSMSSTFNLLRANDLIWSFVINNYLLGKDPFPFDLLYWNSDSTAMPGKMHSYYLRNMYKDNLLSKPNGLNLLDEQIDLTQIETPCYFLSTIEDHIAPWESTYKGAKLMKRNVTFTLSASGHIAGVVNPPSAGKYCYWVNNKLPQKSSEWFSEAKENKGSWWLHWNEWLQKQSKESQIDARIIDQGKLKPLEDAPGSYVKKKAE